MLHLEMGMGWGAIEADGLAPRGTGEQFEVLYICWLTGWTPETVQGMGVQDAVLAVSVYEKLRQLTHQTGSRP